MSTSFYKVTCDQEDTWVRICHTDIVANDIKADMEERYAPNTYTIGAVDLSGDDNVDLAAIYCQMATLTNRYEFPESNEEWT